MSPTPRRIEVNGVSLEVQVDDTGSGPWVLLVHGFPDTHDCWRHQVAALTAAGYRTIAPDLRGFGASDKPAGLEAYEPAHFVGDLLGVLDRLGVERAHLVGHDWGSALVQGLATALPGRVASLSCLSVGHGAALLGAGSEQRQKSWYMLLFQHEGLAEQWLSRDDFANFRELLTEHPDAEEIVERMRADEGALSSALAIYRTAARPERLFGEESLVSAPPLPGRVLGMWSSGDRFLTEQSMTGTAKQVDGEWRYERVEEAGHWLQLDKPDTVNALLLDFLSEV
jgi:pimeloyl-ACP methyl ester carboxylesterase